MRTKLIALAAVAGVFLTGPASAEGIRNSKVPLITRVASVVALAKQPTLVQAAPMPRKPL